MNLDASHLIEELRHGPQGVELDAEVLAKLGDGLGALQSGRQLFDHLTELLCFAGFLHRKYGVNPASRLVVALVESLTDRLASLVREEIDGERRVEKVRQMAATQRQALASGPATTGALTARHTAGIGLRNSNKKHGAH